jgi:antitoxin component YwqK of YwqJK toxin-antitoxin module
LETASSMEDGEKVGNFKNYDSAGHLLLEGNFMAGKLHGDNTAYFPDGAVRHRFRYQEGAKTGTNVEYHANGAVSVKETVAFNGVDTREEAYTPEGKQLSEKTYHKLRPQGTWVFYGEDGKTPRLKETYENGKLHGLRITYYPSGKKQVEEPYQFNMIAGKVINYYEDGGIQSEAEYRSSRMHGLYTSYHPNGKIREQGEYVANRKHKEWREFDQNGQLTKTYVFNAGILAEEK